jgi:hypothetical protein
MGRTCNMHYDWNRPLRRAILGRNDDIRKDFMKLAHEGVDWVKLAQGRV